MRVDAELVDLSTVVLHHHTGDTRKRVGGYNPRNAADGRRDVDRAAGVGELEVDRRRSQPGDRAPVRAARAKVLSVAVLAAVSAESSMLSVVKLGGFWMFRVPRMPCTLPALPTLTVSCPPNELRLVVTPVASTLTVSFPDPVMMDRLVVSAYLKLIAAGARPVIEPQFAPPETNVLRVAVLRHGVDRSSTLIVSKLGGFWMVRGPGYPAGCRSCPR